MSSVGCGDDAPESADATVTQRITREFGRELLSAENRAPLRAHRTIMRLLRGYHDVGTTLNGRVVASIDGLRGQQGWLDENAWVFNVNGIEADRRPADYRLHPGDVVQWDLRDWYTTLDVRATVGAFPETFTRGVFGRRFPVTVDCERDAASACRRVQRLLRDAGVPTDGSRPPGKRPARGLPQRATILVGTWKHWRDRRWPHLIDRGPADSGVFARFAPDTGSLRLLDWNARTVRSEGAGTGLVAAMRPTEAALTWLVTGVDRRGVEHAAAALDDPQLRDAFAAAVTADGIVKLPLRPRSPARAAPPRPLRYEGDSRGEIEVERYGLPKSDEPNVRIPSGPRPTTLEVRDIELGRGDAVGRGDEAVVNYVGYLHSTGKRYDTSYGVDPQPLRVVPGRGSLIDGFERGLRGMRAGGQRMIAIPPRLAYGQRGYPPAVPPGEALVFVVDVEEVRQRIR